MEETPIYYNDEIFERVLNEHQNLHGITCQNNIMSLNNENCNLTYFKLSDIVTKAFNLPKEEFFEYVKINVAATNLLHERDIFSIKKEIDDAIFENNQEQLNINREENVRQLLNNKNIMEKYEDYYTGDIFALYQIYNNAIHNALNSPKQTVGINIIKQAYPNGISNVVSNKDLNGFKNSRTRENNSYTRKLTKGNNYSKAGYVNFILIFYIIVNITIILIANLLRP